MMKFIKINSGAQVTLVRQNYFIIAPRRALTLRDYLLPFMISTNGL